MTLVMGEAQPHDSLFRHVFGDVERGGALLRSLLPPRVRDATRWDTLELRSGSFRDAELAALESDLLFGAELAGREALFYVLVEHQSSPDAAMAWRIWRYVTRIWERHGGPGATLPLVVPIVVYHGARPWTAARSIDGLIDADAELLAALDDVAPRLGYLLDDLTVADAATLRARAMPAFATLALWALRTASDRGFAGAARELVDLFDALQASEGGREALWTLFSYLTKVSAEGEDLVDRVTTHLSRPVKEDVMDLIEQFAEDRRAEGRAEGLRAVLTRLLRLKFGSPSDAHAARIAEAGAGELERWAGRILGAASADDVIGD